jgi:DNA polymerase (family 10)
LSNADIADRLLALAQMLAAQKENPFKIKAYRRAAHTIRAMPESVDDLVRRGADLTGYPGIGKGISSAIREIVQSGTLEKLERLRSEVPAEVAAIAAYPLLDPQRVLRIYRKLKISTVGELIEKLESGAIGEQFGARMEQHVRQAVTPSHEMLLYRAQPLASAIGDFLLRHSPVRRAAVTGAVRRRVEVIGEISLLVDTEDLTRVTEKVARYGGRTEVLSVQPAAAFFKLAVGTVLRLDAARTAQWGLAMVLTTGSEGHLRELGAAGLEKLAAEDRPLEQEEQVYGMLGLPFIPPELREGRGEVALAARGALPALVTKADIRGDLHAHTTSSDGSDTIAEMAAAAKERGYQYLGISDHSQSLKIARGLSEEALREQIRAIDQLNRRLRGFVLLKAAEVDILAGGTLDYPDELLRQLDYTVCFIHSRFQLGRREQTERVLRAMDNPYFNIMGHATGRLLLKRTGYEMDFERVLKHARERGCCFEINSSPDRLDLSAENARLAREAGIPIAISTDAHSTGEFDLIRCGIEQARRAGLDRREVLNCLELAEFRRRIARLA